MSYRTCNDCRWFKPWPDGCCPECGSTTPAGPTEAELAWAKACATLPIPTLSRLLTEAKGE
jgi:hypothetical protein